MSSDTSSSYAALLKFQLSPNRCHLWGTICNSYIPVSYRIHDTKQEELVLLFIVLDRNSVTTDGTGVHIFYEILLIIFRSSQNRFEVNLVDNM